MSHKPMDEFAKPIAAAQKSVKVGGRYQHFRNKQFYTVIDIAILEATEEVAVVYRAEYGDRLKWVRTLKNFTEEVGGIKRFSLADEEVK
ncbi:MAG: DUF1653 domain-containing protein [Candidatus Nomurabacteria bacterium]|jgi:hypothetical protein|nr:DUF1653 domain-containing protein [Candidatus Nomurabacteria bacterium]